VGRGGGGAVCAMVRCGVRGGVGVERRYVRGAQGLRKARVELLVCVTGRRGRNARTHWPNMVCCARNSTWKTKGERRACRVHNNCEDAAQKAASYTQLHILAHPSGSGGDAAEALPVWCWSRHMARTIGQLLPGPFRASHPRSLRAGGGARVWIKTGLKPT
jgi:hypothetical protein